MSIIKVHNSGKALSFHQGQQVVVGILTSVLLTACGGGGGLSAEEKAAQDAAIAAQTAAAQAAAAQVAAAQMAAAAQAAAEKEAALVAARQEISTAVDAVDDDVQAANLASASAGYLALQAGQQGASYQEVAQAVTQTKDYAAQAGQEAEKARSQKVLVAKAMTDAENSQDLVQVQQLLQPVKLAVQAASDARKAAEQALESTRTAAQQVTELVRVAEASRRYTKLDGMGNELPLSASSWSCVKDKNTGMVWEEKTNDGGLRDKDWRYRHMHNSGGYGGLVDTNGQILCKGLGTCDAYSYMYAVNGTGLCGRNNWRIPLPKELGTIAQINPGSTPPHVDMNFFPETANIPTKGAYCTHNVDGAEHNYQGIDFGLPILYSSFPNETPANVLGVSILVPLRYYGEIADGLVNNPGQASNWICYTRLVSSR